MKRDMDLIRKILLEVEKADTFNLSLNIHIAGYSSDEIWYHVMLLHQANFIVASSYPFKDTMVWRPHSLTWQGHEFLEAAKDDARWAKAKSVMEVSGGMVAEILKSLLVSWMNQAVLGQPTQGH